ncbi:nitroreductase family protein [Kribbella steppae]|uniref:Nitroreductase family protein n=1 Tax=Kribbella steppae TaxID=2512223 RepID=A0A4V6NMY5_9ACTN|nr:nitroreductase family protein [Kribbella steppae]TCO20310.1 nitroreductase family protein [Kribbella steppae]
MSTTSFVTEDEVGIMLAAAGQAPSMHNTQPWRFEINGSVIDVLLDTDRALPAADLSNRFVRVGLGAAAFNLRVAAAMLGHETTLAIDPDPAVPDVVVRIFLADRRVPVAGLASLYGEVSRRFTYRGPMVDRPMSPRLMQLLIEAATSEHAELRWLDDEQRAGLGPIVRSADDRDVHEEDRLHERLRWIGGDRTAEGVPDSVLGPLPARAGAVRDLSAGVDIPHREHAAFEPTPVIAVLATADDDERAWVRAGMALQRVWLTATSYELAASFLNQALEYPALRDQVRTLIGRDAWPQLIIRLGYPTEGSGLTPRRPWNETLDAWR